MKLLRYLLLAILMLKISVAGCQVYFSEGFEGGLPAGWNNIYRDSWGGDTVSWKFQNGGYTYTPQYVFTRHPYPAHGGIVNALFQRAGGYVATKLVTKDINLSYARKPVLQFWHAQDSTYFFGNLVNDELKVYYRKSGISPWVLLIEYTQPISSWTQRKIELPPSSLTGTYSIAFDGQSNSGYGTCIDDVQIIETDTFPKTVQSISIVQASRTVAINGSANNAILRINVFVIGNSNSLSLDSLAVTSLNTKDYDIKPSGVKLYSTPDSLFFQNPQLKAQTSFSGSVAKFNSIGYSLNMGNNYFWVTYDLSDTAGLGDVLDLKLVPNSVKISGKYFPSSVQSPSGLRKIVNSAFYDEFETDKGWILTGDFQRTAPQGLGGQSYGNSDPSYSVSGTKILGTDITINNGDYPAGLSNNAFIATTPLINCKYFINTKLSFARWLNINGSDKAAIEISADGGTTWIPEGIWVNPGDVTDNIWKSQVFDISKYADRNPNIKIRFTLGPTGSWPYSGWNIDNFAVYGTNLIKDVGVTGWQAPLSGCCHTSHDSVKITVENYASVSSPSSVPLYYSFDGGTTIVRDTLKTSIPSYGNVSFTFKTPKNLSSPGIYPNVIASTNLAGDQAATNNIFNTSITAFPTYSIPYFENFDSTNVYWTAGGTFSSWQLGHPLNFAPASGINSWDSYNNGDEDSYVESSYINIPDTSKVILELKYNCFFQSGDGVAIYSSIDNGATWNLVPKHSYPWKWNWYNKTLITALGTAGWDTTTNFNWVTAKQVLPSSLMNKSNIKFKIKFESITYGNSEEFAFDDFKLYEAPANIKLLTITSHKDTCLKSIPSKISFKIKNIGIRTMIPSKDKIIAGFKINNRASIIDTLLLPGNLRIGDSVLLTFNKPAAIDTDGLNIIKVFDIDPFQGFYPVADKDTLTLNLTLFANPVTGLPKEVASERLDTVVIRAIENVNYDYKWANNTFPSLSTADTLKNPPAGLVWLSVKQKTDIHNCVTIDTVNVIKLTYDIGISSILSPLSACVLSNHEHVTVSFRNKGIDTLRTNDSIRIAYKFATNDTVWYSYKLNKSFYPGDTLVYSFNSNTIDMSAIKSYSLVAFTKYKYDLNHTNDSVRRTIHNWGYPNVNLGTGGIVAGIDTLHAGPGYKAYLWCDGTTDSIYEARYIGYHWVKVTDVHGCQHKDSVYVKVVFHDIKPSRIINPVSPSCYIGNRKLQISVKNAGTDTIKSGETIHVKYSLNGSGWKTMDTVLTGNFLPGDTIIRRFTTIENFNDTGKYNIVVIASTAGDIDHYNDTLRKTITVFGYPALNLGNDTTVKALQWTLDAGTGNNLSYLWKYGSTNHTYTLTKSDTMFVKVTNNATQCSIRDTIKVYLSIRDGKLTGDTSKFSGCMGTFDNMSVTFTNSGNVAIPAGDSIGFWYSINDSSSETNYVKLSSILQPGHTINHTYSNLKYQLSAGNSQIVFYSILQNEMRHNNDSIAKNIVLWPLPVVDISGGNVDTLTTTPPYTLQAPVGSQYSYLWQDGSHNSSYVATHTGLFNVKVTDNHGCYKRDTVFIQIYTPDGGITSINDKPIICVGDQDLVKMWFKNLGTTIIYKNAFIYFDYRVNSHTTSNLYVLTSDLHPGDSISYTISNIVPSLAVGTNNIKFYSVISEDYNPADDTISRTIIYGSLPLIVLAGGVDSTVMNYKTKLGTGLGSGYSYLWNTGYNRDSVQVTTNRTYSVKVTNLATNCWKTDSVYVTVLIVDGGITKITGDSTDCQYVYNQFQATFTNLGQVTISAGDTVKFCYILNGSAPFIENFKFTTTFAPGQQTTHTFKNLSKKMSAGLNRFKVYSHLKIDAVPADDTMVYNVTIKPAPAINLGSGKDTIFKNPPYLLDAGAGIGYTYSWQDNSTSRTYTVNNNGQYSVNVTNTVNSCSNSDTVYVYTSFIDGALTAFTGSNSGCIGKYGPLSAEVTNQGNLPVNNGDTIFYVLLINGTKRATDAVKLTSTLSAGGKNTHTFSNINAYLPVGSNLVKVYNKITGDYNHDNDTATKTIQISNYPVLYLANGKDSLNYNSTYTLDAGPGYTSYLWNTSAITRTINININSQGWYKVTVSNAGGCQTKDSVYMNYNVGITETKVDNDFIIYPNPASSVINIEVKNTLIENPVIEVYSSDMKLLYTQSFNGKYDFFNETLTIEKWNPGLYYFKVTDYKNNKFFFRKVVIE